MIDVTETMLPSTVMSDRSFDAQMASSAMPADSRSLFMAASGRVCGQVGPEGRQRSGAVWKSALPFPSPAPPAPPALPALRRVHLDRVAVRHVRGRSCTDRSPLRRRLQAVETSKYLSPEMPSLIGTNSTTPLRRTNTPSVSLRVSPGLSSAATATGSTPATSCGAAVDWAPSRSDCSRRRPARGPRRPESGRRPRSCGSRS